MAKSRWENKDQRPSKEQSQEDYLIKLVQEMIQEDNSACGINNGPTTPATQNFIRALPSIAEEYTNPKLQNGIFENDCYTCNTTRRSYFSAAARKQLWSHSV
jgi:hypothetical protein